MTKVDYKPKNLSGMKGVSDRNVIQKMFATSPLNNGEYNDSVVTQLTRDVMNVVVDGSQPHGGTNDDYPSFDPNYGTSTGTPDERQPPDLTKVQPVDGSKFWGQYSPSVGSPGAGSFDAKDIPQLPGAPKGSGMGATTSPHETSKKISEQDPATPQNPGVSMPIP